MKIDADEKDLRESPIERVGWRRVYTCRFGASQGQSWGHFYRTMSVPPFSSRCFGPTKSA